MRDPGIIKTEELSARVGLEERDCAQKELQNACQGLHAD